MEDQLKIDIADRRMKIIHGEVTDAIKNATQAFQNKNEAAMNAYLELAKVKSTLLIAERIDMLIKVINAKTI